VEKAGLYNPFTLGGTIIVNGVVASTHSKWFLDSAFKFPQLTHWLPAAYLMVLFPVRALYRVLGKNLYISVYHQRDAVVDIATFGTSHAAGAFTGMGMSLAMIAALGALKSVQFQALKISCVGKTVEVIAKENLGSCRCDFKLP
jgi:hypothetical protein